MNTLLVAAVVILLVLVAALVFVLTKKSRKPSQAPIDGEEKPVGKEVPVSTGAIPQAVQPSRQIYSNEGNVRPQTQPVLQQAQDQVQKYLEQAKSKAREIIIEAKDEAIKIRSDAENESAKIRSDVSSLEKKVDDKLTQIDIKEQELTDKSQKLAAIKEEVAKEKQRLEELITQAQEKLQNVSGLTKEEAKNQLLVSIDKELKQEKGKRIKQNEEEIKNESDKIARDILITAMQRGATDIVVEHTVSKVRLPDEDIKGRIIGKEGRNIRTFEELTGVDLDMDSSPGDIMISSFDPVRREIARLAMEKLIADGRIQPARIEEIVLATQKDMDQILFKEGENLCHRLGVYNLPRDIVAVLGRLKFRFSYGQNMIEHTIEETRIGVSMAQEIGANVEVVKMGCLLHDVGKVIADEEGTHVQIGVDFLRKYKIADAVINCVAEHHEDRPFSSVESAVVNLADHMSGARPGARSEDYESYKKRMEDLEQAATSFDGVEKAYAISAGREVRVIVKPDRVDDSTASILAREIAKKIELEQSYPGVVKVTVIREVRVSETAK